MIPKIILASLAMSVVVCTAGVAQAQAWPTRPIRVVVGFAAGGGTDAVARGVAPRLSELLGQPVVIDNRPGANGALGADLVAKAQPDGYTLHMGAAGTLVIAPHLGANLPFDTFRDFAPVSLAAMSPFIVSLHPSVPAASVRELVALAKAQPGRLTVGSSGNGGAPHLAAELFKSMAGVDIVHVPYKGLAPAVSDLLGGQIQVVFADVSLVRGHIASGKLKGLATTGSNRLADQTDLPTVAESGVPGYAAGTWYGLFAPAATPPEIVARLSEAARKVLDDAEVRSGFARLGLEAAGNTPQAFAAMVRAESDKWGAVISKANVKVQ